MSIRIFRSCELSEKELTDLHRKLVGYYSKPPDSYYVIANESAGKYQPETTPFHCDLASRVEMGMSLLELGCGSAHLCPYIEAAGGHYTGIDYSLELLERNRRLFPQAIFHQTEAEVREQFDVVASLYTIEHVVDPPAYLERMWNFCKPGGLLAVICPEFVDAEPFPPCFYFGKSPRRLREKLSSMALMDALLHGVDLFWNAPRWKARARSTPPGAFWINTRPSELEGRIHDVDTDAVHLPRRVDIEWWFKQRGAEIIITSDTFPKGPPEVVRFNCYVVARKSANSPG